VNARKPGGTKIEPTPSDLNVIKGLYGVDFERFGYEIGEKMPKAAAPVLSPEMIAERDEEIKAAGSARAKVSKIAGKIKKKIGG